MQNISLALGSHLQGEITTLATCWKLTLRDETVLGFTDHSADIRVDAENYEAGTGFTPSAIVSSSSLSVDNLDIEGMVDSDIITAEDIVAGRFDFAELEVFIVNYHDTSQGKLILKKGWLGELSLDSGQFIAEVRGLSEYTNSVIGNLYSPSCRVKFGDNSCKLNVEAFTVSGVVAFTDSSRVIEDATRSEEDGYFTNGKITFTNGRNTGLIMEIKEYKIGRITLALPMPYPLEIMDSYSVTAGCDKTFPTCAARFNNAINFRGEPHVPGMDRMLQTA